MAVLSHGPSAQLRTPTRGPNGLKFPQMIDDYLNGVFDRV